MKLSYTENKILRKLAILNIKRDTTLSSIAVQLQISRTNMTFCHIIKVLFESNIFELKNTIGKTKIIAINNTLLQDLIESQPDYDEFSDYAAKFKIYSD